MARPVLVMAVGAPITGQFGQTNDQGQAHAGGQPPRQELVDALALLFPLGSNCLRPRPSRRRGPRRSGRPRHGNQVKKPAQQQETRRFHGGPHEKIGHQTKGVKFTGGSPFVQSTYRLTLAWRDRLDLAGGSLARGICSGSPLPPLRTEPGGIPRPAAKGGASTLACAAGSEKSVRNDRVKCLTPADRPLYNRHIGSR